MLVSTSPPPCLILLGIDIASAALPATARIANSTPFAALGSRLLHATYPGHIGICSLFHEVYQM